MQHENHPRGLFEGRLKYYMIYWEEKCNHYNGMDAIIVELDHAIIGEYLQPWKTIVTTNVIIW